MSEPNDEADAVRLISAALSNLATQVDSNAVPGHQAHGNAWRTLIADILPYVVQLLHKFDSVSKQLSIISESLQMRVRRLQDGLDVASASVEGLSDRQLAVNRTIRQLRETVHELRGLTSEHSDRLGRLLPKAQEEVAGKVRSAGSAVPLHEDSGEVPAVSQTKHNDSERIDQPSETASLTTYDEAVRSALDFVKMNKPPSDLIEAEVFERYIHTIAAHLQSGV